MTLWSDNSQDLKSIEAGLRDSAAVTETGMLHIWGKGKYIKHDHGTFYTNAIQK